MLSSLDPGGYLHLTLFFDIDGIDFDFNCSDVDIDPQVSENYRPIYINKREKVGASESSDSDSDISDTEED